MKQPYPNKCFWFCRNHGSFYVCSCHQNTQPDSWEDGKLIVDKINDILKICNVKDVKIEQNRLIINFAPKDATGKV